jgi:hypothetical protein
LYVIVFNRDNRECERERRKGRKGKKRKGKGINVVRSVERFGFGIKLYPNQPN